MTNQLRQRLAVSALLVNCEAACASGLLGERREKALRWAIAETRSAFGSEIPEREAAYHRTLEDVAREMGTV